MAYADYRLCDVCGGKTFYDANLNYDQGADVEGSVRNAGVLLQHTRLDYLGDWCVICHECAKTHECRVVQKDGHATAQAHALAHERRARIQTQPEKVIMTITMKEKEIVKPTKLNQLESGDTFTLEDGSGPYIVLDETDNGLFQFVGLETGVIYRNTGDDVVFPRNYVLKEVS